MSLMAQRSKSYGTAVQAGGNQFTLSNVKANHAVTVAFVYVGS
jgi:hypothetical protein